LGADPVVSLRLGAALAVLGLLLGAAPAGAQDDPHGLSQAHLRHVSMVLPRGLSLSPAAADGLVACSDEQLQLGNFKPATCPEAAKIGTVSIASPAVREELTGSVYLRPSTQDQLFRIALTANSELVAVRMKLPGTIDLDPTTGQVTATFSHLPQLPFSSMHLRFKGGPRAILANPPDCGTYATHSVLTPWSGMAPVVGDTLFQIGGDSCPQTLPFDPAIVAGTINPVARAFTPFIFRVQRRDARQELERLAVTLPPGVSAKLAGVRRCATVDAAVGACAPAARIGLVTIGAGAGSSPLYLSGSAYLTDAYGGGQFGLALVVRAVAGPLDLGTVVVRAAVKVNPTTAQLAVVADPLPRILKGVPLRLRDVHLAIDRPGFILNPTSCRPLQVQVAVGAVQGARVDRAIPFQVGDCSALDFSPTFSVKLTGRGQTTDGKRPGLRVAVRTRPGQANLRSTAFTLPPQIAFDASRGGPRMCTRAQLAARDCPRRSQVGTARAVSPLLGRPIEGPVYFIRGVRGDIFPKLAMLLAGELPIDLLGSTKVTHGGLTTTFGTLPDVPLRSFTLKLAPGLLTPTRDLCARTSLSDLTMSAQNGRRVERRVRVAVPCGRASQRGR
jgi:hypothetical protein